MPPSWIKSLQDKAAQAGGSRVPEMLSHADWSRSLANLSSSGTFSEGLLAGLALPGEVSVMAFEPVLGYLAVGTSVGTIHIFGAPAVQLSFTLRPAHKVSHLAFKSDTGLLVCIDEKDNISVYDLKRPDPHSRAAHGSSSSQYRASSSSTGHNLTGPPHPDTPQRVGVHTARNRVTCLEISSVHSHLFLGLRDGTVDTFDLDRMCASPYRVPNLWWEEEEILRKSGVPDAPNRRHVPLIIEMRTHPKDINQLLLAYEGGAILLDIKERVVLKTYQVRLLPGAPGAGGDPNLIWTERSPPATCVAWRPDGELFAMGHEDGCISFWHARDDDKPIMVRTLDQLDVEKPLTSMDGFDTPRPSKEPIYKLAWSGFPDKGWIEMASESASSWQAPQHQRKGSVSQESEQTNTRGTVLTILGGAKVNIDAPGLFCVHMPPYTASLSLWGGNTPEAHHKLRTALYHSLEPTAETTYATPAIVEDFMLLPKLNPHYSNTYDPMAVVTLLASDPTLPTLPPPAAARGMACYVFPPRSNTSDPVGSPTFSAFNLHAQSPPGMATPLRFGLSVPTPQKEMHLPLPLTLAGAGAIIGAKFATLTPHAYRKLVGTLDVTGVNQRQEDGVASTAMRSAHDDRKPPLHLLGGKASASLSGDGRDTVADVLRSSKFRVLLTWHLDGSVRFYDASPHLLLSGEVDEADLRDQITSPRIWLRRGFPSPLPHLTIEVRTLLQDPSMSGHPTFDRIRERARVQDVQFAAEVLEASIALSTGQLLHYRFDFARLSETKAINEEVETSIREETEANLMIPPLASPRTRGDSSASHGLVHSSAQDAVRNQLDDDMSRAMEELKTTDQGNASASVPDAQMSSHGTTGSDGSQPPPRPRRDPKRISGPPRAGPHFNAQVIPMPTQSDLASEVDEVVLLQHTADYGYDGFKPNLMLNPMRGEISAFACSDIGFLAVACGTALAVMDFRGAELVLREGFGDQQDYVKQSKSSTKESRKMTDAEGKSAITSLQFSVCRVGDDPSLAPRLIVMRSSGFMTVWTLHKTLDMWMMERTSGHKLDELSQARRLDILDIAGNSCPALPNELQRALREQEYGPIGGMSDSKLPDANLLLGFTDRCISLRFGVTGPVVARTEIGEKLLGCGLIERANDKVAAVVTGTSIRLYTLPRLEPITRLQRHHREVGETMGTRASVSFDTRGDFVEVCSSLDVRLWTMFGALRRPGQPSLTLYPQPLPRTIPLHPGSVGSAAGVATSIAGWFGTKTTGILSIGAQMDTILAGPKRPEPPKLGEPLPARDYRPKTQTLPASELAAQKEPVHPAPNAARPAASLPSARRDASKSRAVAEQADAATATGYQNLDLLKARGAMMSGIEDGLTSLERGASSFMKNTRDMAIKGAAKDKLNKFMF